MKNLLNLLHGETPTKINLCLIYGIGFIASIILFSHYSQNTGIERVIRGIVGLDIVGGIIANLSTSTKKWWQSQSKYVQYLFLVLHIIQPIIFGYILDVDLKMMLSLFMYVLICGLILINLGKELNRIFAVIFAGIGILVFSHIGMQDWFFIAYIFKLVVGFCIKW